MTPSPPNPRPDPDRTTPLVDDEPGCATVLDPTAWGTPVADPGPPPVPPPTPPPPPTPQPYEVRRFGPGVPPAVAAAWHGTPPPPPLRRRTLPWLVPAAVVVALLAVLPTRCRAEPPLTPTGLTVTATPVDGPPCDGTAVFTATVTTDGHPGTVHYRWQRDDGTVSGELLQPVRSGEYRTDLVLSWSFVGHGALHATATVEILSPRSLSATASFDYTCPE
ncbi:hypothetical protein [Kitasatospora purpeofusca]|uniref:Ig-like domain-containing protein n=1 Tax=Kitasatospora purpeofusca TaxID=67352 RepID=A0ABZ1UAH1_9ACTN|nr:hypothetical protein [Kitasatospora purpeofusca]